MSLSAQTRPGRYYKQHRSGFKRVQLRKE